jgi:hypothetical protein
VILAIDPDPQGGTIMAFGDDGEILDKEQGVCIEIICGELIRFTNCTVVCERMAGMGIIGSNAVFDTARREGEIDRQCIVSSRCAAGRTSPTRTCARR